MNIENCATGILPGGEVQQWHGYNLLGDDGSTAELPNSAEIQKEYRVFKHCIDGKAISMGRTLMVYDAINYLTLQRTIDKIQESETSMEWKSLPDMDLKEDDLLIFDRYYASH